MENTSTRTNRPLLFRTIVSIKLRFIYSEGIWDPQFKELSFLNHRNNFRRRKKGLWLSKTSAQDVVGSSTSKLWERKSISVELLSALRTFFQMWLHLPCAPSCTNPWFDRIYFPFFLFTTLWSNIFRCLSFNHSLIAYIFLSFFSPLVDRIYFPVFLFTTLWSNIFFYLFFHHSLIEYISLLSWLLDCLYFARFWLNSFWLHTFHFFHFTLLPSLIKSRPHAQTPTQNDSTDISWSALKGFKLQNSRLKSSDEIFGQRGQGGCMCLLLWKCNARAATFCGQV